MERFRLVVAANDILSDAVKKTAYDRYGLGWDEGRAAETVRRQTARERRAEQWKQEKHAGKTEGMKGWAKFTSNFSHANTQPDYNDSPAGNATWEDWERWYKRDDPIPVQPLTTNANFITFVVLFVLVGGLMQVNRLDTNAIKLVEGRERQHVKLAKDMSRIEREVCLSGGRQERIEAFIEIRDPGSRFVAMEEGIRDSEGRFVPVGGRRDEGGFAGQKQDQQMLSLPKEACGCEERRSSID